MTDKAPLSLLQAIFFAAAGVLVAGLLTAQHYDIALAEKMCDIERGCAKVLASRYSSVAGVPNAVIGTAFYALVLVGLLWGMAGGTLGRLRGVLGGCEGGALAGAAVSLALMVVQFAVLRAFCPLCTLSALLSFMLLVSIHDARGRNPWPPMPLRATLLAGCLLVAFAFAYAAVQASRDAGPRPELLARIDRQILTTRDLEREPSAAIEDTTRSLYEARRDWLDRKIADTLIDAEADRRNLDRSQLLKDEVDNKIADALSSLDQWLAREKANPDFDWVAARRRAAEELYRQRFNAYVDSLRPNHQIELFLHRPPGRLGDLDPSLVHTLGPPNPTIRFVLFSDFQCPYCAELTQSLEALRDKFSFEVSVTYVHYPMPSHDKALPAAIAAEAAARQGKFWLYHDLLMKQNGSPDGDWEKIARALDLDLDRFRSDQASPALRDRVERSRRQAQDLGVTAVPSLYLNGRRIGGLLTLEELTQLVRLERRAHSTAWP